MTLTASERMEEAERIRQRLHALASKVDALPAEANGEFKQLTTAVVGKLTTAIQVVSRAHASFVQYVSILQDGDVEGAIHLLDVSERLLSRLTWDIQYRDSMDPSRPTATLDPALYQEHVSLLDAQRLEVVGRIEARTRQFAILQAAKAPTGSVGDSHPMLANAAETPTDELLGRLLRRVDDGVQSVERRNFEFSIASDRVMKRIDEADSVLRSEAIRLASAESAILFRSLRDSHRRFERGYAFAVVIAVIGAIVAVILVVNSQISADAKPVTAVAYVFHNLLILSGLGVLLRALMSKYNLERNLHILYDHRVTVLAQYSEFERAISSGNDNAKDSLRLEIMKYVFSDPKTGYAPEKSADFTIAPVIQLMDSLSPKKS